MRTVIENALISVIVPVHNRFELARQAIDSVLKQSYRPVEIVVVDDLSDEPFSFSLDQSAGDVKLRLIRLEMNSGPGVAREAGRKHAQGEFIAYLDSDDSYAPLFLERLAAALLCAPEAGMAYCTALQQNSTGCRSVRRRSDESFTSILPTVLYGRPWPTAGCLWRRSAADLAAPWEALWWWEDYLHDVRAGCAGVSLVHVKEPLCFVLQAGDEQVSDRRNSRNFRRGQQSIARALILIAEAISRTAWATNLEIRHRLGHLALTHAINSLDLGLREEAIALSRLATFWGVENSNVSLNLGRAFASAGLKPLALRMWRRCRRRLDQRLQASSGIRATSALSD